MNNPAKVGRRSLSRNRWSKAALALTLFTAVANGSAQTDGRQTEDPCAISPKPQKTSKVKLTPAIALERGGVDSDAASGLDFHWIPGTHRLLYVATTSGKSWVCTIDVETQTTKALRQGTKAAPASDGKRFAFLSPDASGVQLQLWVATLDGREAKQLTHFPPPQALHNFPVEYEWSPDSKRILYKSPISVNDDGKWGAIPPDEIQAKFGSRVLVYPHTVTAKLGQELFAGSAGSSSYRVVDIESGESTQVLANVASPDSAGWFGADQLYYVERIFEGSLRFKTALWVHDIKSGRNRIQIDGYSVQGGYDLKRSPSGRLAFAADRYLIPYPAPRDLAVIDEKGDIQLLTKDRVLSIGAWSPDERSVLVTDGMLTQRNLHRITLTGGRTQLTTEAGSHRYPAFSSDGKWLAWVYTSVDQRVSLRVGRWGDTSIEEARELAVLHDPTRGVETGQVSVVQWPSKDGTTVDGVLILPRGHVTARGAPLVTILHGGPLSGLDESWKAWPGAYYFPHLLAASGYSVLIPTYRSDASGGFDQVIAARGKERYQKDFEDVESGISYLVSKGIADAERTFLLGHSAGAALTNWIVTHSGRFRGAIAYDGVGDIVISWGHPGWGFANTSWEWWMGGKAPMKDFSAWLPNSAIMGVLQRPEAIRTPTMFVKCNDSWERMDDGNFWLYVAFQNLGIDSQYIQYPDDGHVVAKPENQRDLMHRILSWIAKHDEAGRPEPATLRMSLQ